MVDPDRPLVAAWDKHGMKFVMREMFTFDGFRGWLDRFVAGELQPFMQSQEIPDSFDKYDEGVKVVVADTWEEEVAR